MPADFSTLLQLGGGGFGWVVGGGGGGGGAPAPGTPPPPPPPPPTTRVLLDLGFEEAERIEQEVVEQGAAYSI